MSTDERWSSGFARLVPGGGALVLIYLFVSFEHCSSKDAVCVLYVYVLFSMHF